jgi:hypothetical protein
MSSVSAFLLSLACRDFGRLCDPLYFSVFSAAMSRTPHPQNPKPPQQKNHPVASGDIPLPQGLIIDDTF